jgi:hypothetical protein
VGDELDYPGTWRPQSVWAFIEGVPSSTRPVRVLTDLGDAYLKGLGNAEGPHALAKEWVGTCIAYELGAPTFSFGLVNVPRLDEIVLPMHGGALIQPGPAFVTRAENGAAWSGDSRPGNSQLQLLCNKDDITRLVVVDTFLRNWDRYFVHPNGRVAQNLGNVFLSTEAPKGQFALRAFDFNNCLMRGDTLRATINSIDNVRDNQLYGLFPPFRGFLDRNVAVELCTRLACLDTKTVGRIVRTIPQEWEVSSETREAVVAFLVSRAAYLSEQLLKMLWPVNTLFPA